RRWWSSGTDRARARLAALLPLSRRRGPFDGVENALVLHAVFEVRRGKLLGVDGVDQIFHGVREAVLVADEMAGGPPAADVGVLRVGNEHRAKAAVRTFVEVELELVQAFEIEDHAPLAAVHLEAVVVLATEREARALD